MNNEQSASGGMDPAEAEAAATMSSVMACLDGGQHFRLEAGAGSGKTHSLIESLKRVIAQDGERLVRSGQRIACVTYTNGAVSEIRSRIDSHPAVAVSTIHAFCWDLLQPFQCKLWEILPRLDEKGWWGEAVTKLGASRARPVRYDLGRRSARPDRDDVRLGHDDVISAFVRLSEFSKFRDVIASRFPVVFIDEYQDTDSAIAEVVVRLFAVPGRKPLIGLYGDAWQRIYKNGCGGVSGAGIRTIEKKSNFRSSDIIVECLNRIRPELAQTGRGEKSGSVRVFHTNAWPGERLTGQHYGGDLPPDEVTRFIEMAKTEMSTGSDLASPKILMLTHNALAKEQQYQGIIDSFGSDNNDDWLKKQNPVMRYLLDVVLPALDAFGSGKFGKMLNALGSEAPKLESADERRKLKCLFLDLSRVLVTGTVGDLLDRIAESDVLGLPDGVEEALQEKAPELGSDGKPRKPRVDVVKLRAASCRELRNVQSFINGSSPYATQHGVKGDEFESVLVVLGRGWNEYNWDKFICMEGAFNDEKERKFYERNRNLFYVACSRACLNLRLLFTQTLSPKSIGRLEEWFGAGTVSDLSIIRPS